jgi:hypothetical protein
VSNEAFDICHTCTPPHVSNCARCFGYGLTGNMTPIAAGEVEEYIRHQTHYLPCPVCGGTPTNRHLQRHGEIEIPDERLRVLE